MQRETRKVFFEIFFDREKISLFSQLYVRFHLTRSRMLSRHCVMRRN